MQQPESQKGNANANAADNIWGMVHSIQNRAQISGKATFHPINGAYLTLNPLNQVLAHRLKLLFINIAKPIMQQ
jgi:hypothetical protein